MALDTIIEYQVIKRIFTAAVKKVFKNDPFKPAIEEVLEDLRKENQNDWLIVEEIRSKRKEIFDNIDICDEITFQRILTDNDIELETANRLYKKLIVKFNEIIKKAANKKPEIFYSYAIQEFEKIDLNDNDLKKALSNIFINEEIGVEKIIQELKGIDADNRKASREILERITSIEQKISSKRPISPVLSSTYSVSDQSELLKNIKTAWLKRFHKPLDNIFELQAEGKFKIEMNEKFLDILNDLVRERELHDADDIGFVIKEEMNIIEAGCFFGLGQNLHVLKDYKNAIEAYEKAIFLGERFGFEKNMISMYYKSCAVAHIELKEYKTAIENFDKLIKLDSDCFNAYVDRGNCYYYLNQYHKAIEDYNNALKINQNEAYVYNNRGSVYADLEQYERAIEDYYKAIELDEECETFYYGLGLVYNNIEQYEKSLEEYTRAIELKPTYAEAFNNRGVSYLELKEVNKAIDDWNKATELNPNLSAAYVNLGSAYRTIKRYDVALESLNKTIGVNPNLAPAYFNRGWVFWELKQYTKAIEDFNKVIELNPDNSRSYNHLGLVYCDLEQHDKALEYFNKALKIDPHDENLYINRGNLFFGLRQYVGAIADYNKSIELSLRQNPHNVFRTSNHASELFLSLKFASKPLD